MMMTLLPSLAYEGAGVSAQQHWALHPPLPPPLLHPSFLVSPCPRQLKWSQLAERRLWLRPPAQLQTEINSEFKFSLI